MAQIEQAFQAHEASVQTVRDPHLHKLLSTLVLLAWFVVVTLFVGLAVSAMAGLDRTLPVSEQSVLVLKVAVSLIAVGAAVRFNRTRLGTGQSSFFLQCLLVLCAATLLAIIVTGTIGSLVLSLLAGVLVAGFAVSGERRLALLREWSFVQALDLSHPSKEFRGPDGPDAPPAPCAQASSWSCLAERFMDVAFAGLALVALVPVFVVIALAIRLETRGPVLFRQKRVGQGGQVFRIYKFRTMTCCEDGPTIRQATANDMRVTRVGRVLRKYSIDELPQVLNVLSGAMSVVGPRPHAVAHDVEYGSLIGCYTQRHSVKPGITGWAQVNGHRGETSSVDAMRQRVIHDLIYIRHKSPAFYLVIIVLTVREIIKPTNVY